MKELLELGELERIVNADAAAQAAWLNSVGRNLLLVRNRKLLRSLSLSIWTTC